MNEAKKYFRTKCANAIDSSWKYSWHWPEYGWEKVALKQARGRMADMISDLASINAVISQLENTVEAEDE